MSWSLGETGALAIKAARGAGFAWGLAEDAGFAVVWLQARGLPGAPALCSYLSWYAANNHRQDEQTGRCPLLTGAAISDGVVTEKERSMLQIQATSYGFTEERVDFLEAFCRESMTEEE